MNIPVMLRHAAATSDEPTECSNGLAAISAAATATGDIFSLDAVLCQRVLCTLDKHIHRASVHNRWPCIACWQCSKSTVYHSREERGACYGVSDASTMP